MKKKPGNVKWLVGATLTSLVAGFVVVRFFEFIVAGAVGTAANAAKATLFSSAWAAITGALGMRAFDDGVQQVRHGVKKVSRRIDRRIDRT